MTPETKLTIFLAERLVEVEARLKNLEQAHKAVVLTVCETDPAEEDRRTSEGLKACRVIAQSAFLDELRSRQIDDVTLELITQAIQ